MSTPDNEDRELISSLLGKGRCRKRNSFNKEMPSLLCLTTPDNAGTAIWLLLKGLTFPYIKEIVKIAVTVSEYSFLPQIYIIDCGLQTCLYFSNWASEAYPSLQISVKYIEVWKWISHTPRQGVLNLGSMNLDEKKNHTIIFANFSLGFITSLHYDYW